MQNPVMFVMCAIASFPPWGMVLKPLGFEAQMLGLTVQLIGLGVLFFRRRHIF